MAKRKREQARDPKQEHGDETQVMPAINVPGAGADVAAPAGEAEEAPATLALDAEAVIERAPLAAIVEVNGPGDGRVTLIPGGRCVIGRLAPELNLRLPYDRWVSRAHARVSYQEGAWTLEDLHSSNGTWLESGRTRVSQPVTITPGQIFRVGHTDLMLIDNPDPVAFHGEPL